MTTRRWRARGFGCGIRRRIRGGPAHTWYVCDWDARCAPVSAPAPDGPDVWICPDHYADGMSDILDGWVAQAQLDAAAQLAIRDAPPLTFAPSELMARAGALHRLGATNAKLRRFAPWFRTHLDLRGVCW